MTCNFVDKVTSSGTFHMQASGYNLPFTNFRRIFTYGDQYSSSKNKVHLSFYIM